MTMTPNQIREEQERMRLEAQRHALSQQFIRLLGIALFALSLWIAGAMLMR